MRVFALGETQLLGEQIARGMDVGLDPIEERDFPGGEHKSRPLVSVRGEDVYVIAGLHATERMSPAERLIRLLFFLATCRENGALRVTAIVPYLAFMRKEVQTKPRDPVTSKYVAVLFEAMRPDMIVTIEAHNKAAFQNAFRCPTLHLDMYGQFARWIGDRPQSDKLVFLSPDSGGSKRVELLRQACAGDRRVVPTLALMEKHRSDDVVSGDLFAGDVEGADVVIFDDMISTGGTMLRAANSAKSRGAKQVVAMATHGLFAPTSSDLLSASSVDRVVVSDTTAPFSPGVSLHNRLETVSCARLLAETIKRLHGGGSIHRLIAPTS